MNKIRNLLIFMSFAIMSFGTKAQMTGGEAFYKIVVHNSLNADKAEGSFKDDLLAALVDVKDMRPRLSFTSQHALYEANQSITTTSLVMAAISYCDCDIPYYYSKEEGKAMQYNSSGPFMGEKQYLIEQPLDLKWKIGKETKKIDQYTCYKATALSLDSDGDSQPVEAWFCPEIPFAYGPRGFGGLPGLILELRYDRSVIGLESLQLSSKPVQIKMPTEGKRISFAEFNNINKPKLAKFLEEQQK
jgi:GLPGLI family protein